MLRAKDSKILPLLTEPELFFFFLLSDCCFFFFSEPDLLAPQTRSPEISHFYNEARKLAEIERNSITYNFTLEQREISSLCRAKLAS